MSARGRRVSRGHSIAHRMEPTMHTSFFSGRMLDAQSFQAEQSYLRPPHHAGAGSLLDAVALNPQPLPPRSASEQLVSSLPPSILDQVALNPQPLPPKDFDAVALNPQPLPPRESIGWR